MNIKIPAVISAALVLLFGCSYTDYAYKNAYIATDYSSENPVIQNSHLNMAVPVSDENIPADMTNKHIARIKKTEPDGNQTILALYSYDDSGREIASTIGRYTVKREYDSSENTTVEEKYIDGRLSSYIEYKYDIDQRLVSQRRYTSDGHTIYGVDTFDIEYDSHGRIVSKTVHASKAGEIIKYYYRYNVSENSGNQQINTDSNTISTYIKIYADGGDHVICEEYRDNMSPENNYLLKYNYRIDARGRLSISVTDVDSGIVLENRIYQSDDLSKPLDSYTFDKEGNYFSAEDYLYDDNGEVILHGRVNRNDDGDYEVDIYIYDEKETGLDYDFDKLNAYDILGKDYDERISKFTVYRDYSNGKFKEILVYGDSGDLKNKFLYFYNNYQGYLFTSREYNARGTLVSKTDYTYDDFGNILKSKRYEFDKLVETLTYDYQVVPGAFCEPYTVEPKIRS